MKSLLFGFLVIVFILVGFGFLTNDWIATRQDLAHLQQQVQACELDRSTLGSQLNTSLGENTVLRTELQQAVTEKLACDRKLAAETQSKEAAIAENVRLVEQVSVLSAQIAVVEEENRNLFLLKEWHEREIEQLIKINKEQSKSQTASTQSNLAQVAPEAGLGLALLVSLIANLSGKIKGRIA